MIGLNIDRDGGKDFGAADILRTAHGAELIGRPLSDGFGVAINSTGSHVTLRLHQKTRASWMVVCFKFLARQLVTHNPS